MVTSRQCQNNESQCNVGNMWGKNLPVFTCMENPYDVSTSKVYLWLKNDRYSFNCYMGVRLTFKDIHKLSERGELSPSTVHHWVVVQ